MTLNLFDFICLLWSFLAALSLFGNFEDTFCVFRNSKDCFSSLSFFLWSFKVFVAFVLCLKSLWSCTTLVELSVYKWFWSFCQMSHWLHCLFGLVGFLGGFTQRSQGDVSVWLLGFSPSSSLRCKVYSFAYIFVIQCGNWGKCAW